MSDNNFPSGRYDDRELAEYTKALRNLAPITPPKLHSKGDYKAWKSEVPLHFDLAHLETLRMEGSATMQTSACAGRIHRMPKSRPISSSCYPST
ncbi:hypothetical protein PF005_g8598 [Phytophthora fragariae]|uniref:Uncharacterized protein n=1 Tax=Phytophthora fragariae TaxID=53985 RepID=A0A6A3YEX9_9STRA|nr:hypothetical protein PF005_g8598 [Phytophthora fragariae]